MFYQDADAECSYDAHVLLSEMRFMMQMSYAGMKIWSLFMMASVHIFKFWCKCLFVHAMMRISAWEYVMMQMPPCRYDMIRMSAWEYAYDANVPLVHAMMRMVHWYMLWCECPFGDVPWCECPIGACHDANVPLVHAMMRMSLGSIPWCKCSCRYVMMQMFM